MTRYEIHVCVFFTVFFSTPQVDLWFTTDPSSAVTLPQVTYDRCSYLKHVRNRAFFVVQL